jgi:hypothetical protein
MKCVFSGGPFDGRELIVSNEYGRLHRLEVRITSENGEPIPRAWQRVAVYGRPPGRLYRVREFIGMADEDETP